MVSVVQPKGVSGSYLRRPRIKFCGMTRVEDALAAVELGVDAIGCVCFAGSQRAVSPTQAAQIAAVLPRWVMSVALFVNPSVHEVETVIQTMQPTMLQFHGDEPADFCNRFGLPYIKAFRVDQDFEYTRACAEYGCADSLLFDTAVAGTFGGTGHTFDWSLFPRSKATTASGSPQIKMLAGGLTHMNVREAIRIAHPDVVDVSSGIECEGQPGEKDLQKMSEFVRVLIPDEG